MQLQLSDYQLVSRWFVNPVSIVSRRKAVKVLSRNVSTVSLAARPRLGFQARTVDCVSVAETPSLPTFHWTLAEEKKFTTEDWVVLKTREEVFFVFTLAWRRHA